MQWAEDIAGDEAGPAPGQTATGESVPAAGTAVAKSSNSASKALAVTALILGALGLIAGLSALAIARPNTRRTERSRSGGL